MNTVEENPALARKRRIEQRRACHRAMDGSDGTDLKKPRLSSYDYDEDDGTSTSESDDLGSRVPSIRGIKRQTRYEPGVPMTKEELQKWRKQARRVRNRESAAASRQKTRERINELESEVSDLQAELAKARARIAELEAISQHSSPLFGSTQPDNDTKKLCPLSPNVSARVSQVSPVPSPVSSPTSLTRSLSLSPQGFSLDSCAPSVPLPTMNSRPTAD